MTVLLLYHRHGKTGVHCSLPVSLLRHCVATAAGMARGQRVNNSQGVVSFCPTVGRVAIDYRSWQRYCALRLVPGQSLLILDSSSPRGFSCLRKKTGKGTRFQYHHPAEGSHARQHRYEAASSAVLVRHFEL